VELTVQTASVDSRAEGRDKALRSEDYFHSARYPAMTFRSTSVKALGNDQFAVTGDFMIRDVTKRITVPVKLLGVNAIGGEMGDIVAFETTFTINRLDYRVGTPTNWLANDVAIHLLVGASSNGRTASR
jgi:polyisoprenoid-binding protein YceI